MFNRIKFICSKAEIKKSYRLVTIQHNEMFKCVHRSILCPSQDFQLNNNVKNVFIHSSNSSFHLVNCKICKSL